MKKTWIVVAMVLLFAVSTAAWAVTETKETTETKVIVRNVVVKGDEVRGPLVAGLIDSYFPDTKGVVVEDKTLGEYVEVTGPNGTEKIHFTPKLVDRLKKLSANPRSAEGLMNICPSQAKSLIKAIGPMKEEKRTTTVTTSNKTDKEPNLELRKKVAASKCANGKCWNPKPEGEYPKSNIKKIGNAFFRVNTGHSHFKKNNLVSAKAECHAGKFEDWVVMRNATVSSENLFTPEFRQVLADYFAEIKPLKANHSCDKEGKSCLEKTWEINPETGIFSVFKNDSR